MKKATKKQDGQVPESLQAKLRKILELAQNGRAGEREAAREKLEALLKKHNLELEDIKTERTRVEWYRYASKAEYRLLVQIVCQVTNSQTMHSEKSRSKRNQVGLRLTNLQHRDVEWLFGIHKRSLKKHLEDAIVAYIYANNIFSEGDGGESTPLTKEEKERLRRVLGMASTMAPTSIFQQVGAG